MIWSMLAEVKAVKNMFTSVSTMLGISWASYSVPPESRLISKPRPGLMRLAIIRPIHTEMAEVIA